jgi:hypothetical protein
MRCSGEERGSHVRAVEERAAACRGNRCKGGRVHGAGSLGPARGTRSHGRRQGHDGLRVRRRNNERLSWGGGRQIEGLALVAEGCGPAGLHWRQRGVDAQDNGEFPQSGTTREEDVNGPHMFGCFAQRSLDADAFAKNEYNDHFCAFKSD